MNRIDKEFKINKDNRLSVYFTAGYPTLNSTTEIIKCLSEKGADLIEIGIPFSDPMADGVVIQESSGIAIKNGMKLKLLFEQLKDIRKETEIPLILMGYLNPILRFGFEDFCIKCKEVGVDGLIIPDLPFKDYMETYKSITEKYNIKLTMLITPETSRERIELIDKETDGFIYMVSTASTTGTKDSFNDDTINYFKTIDDMKLSRPKMIGFGISNEKTYSDANTFSQGAIIGSLFIKLLKENSVNIAVDQLFERIGKN